jgi:hypothetical protein
MWRVLVTGLREMDLVTYPDLLPFATQASLDIVGRDNLLGARREVVVGSPANRPVGVRGVKLLQPDSTQHLHGRQGAQGGRRRWRIDGAQHREAVCAIRGGAGGALGFRLGQAVLLDPVAIALKPLRSDQGAAPRIIGSSRIESKSIESNRIIGLRRVVRFLGSKRPGPRLKE